MKSLRLIVCGIVAAAVSFATIARAEGEAKPPLTPREAALQRAAASKANAEARRAEFEKNREANKKVMDQKIAEAKARIEARKAEWQKFIAARQQNQENRIQHGIDKGFLNDDEIAKLKSQQSAIASLIEACKQDGRLQVEEIKKINQSLDQASRIIWAEKRDNQGKPMSVFALGKNIKLNPVVANMLSDENLQKEEAREIGKDFHRMLVIKHTLATAEMAPEAREKLAEEFATLLNKYFYKADE